MSAPQTSPRPPVAAEVRAWALAVVTLMVQTIGIVWWAATLSAQVNALREVVTELKSQLAVSYSSDDAARDLTPIRTQLLDHEARIRSAEQSRRGLTR
jgi:hypothetical protein